MVTLNIDDGVKARSVGSTSRGAPTFSLFIQHECGIQWSHGRKLWWGRQELVTSSRTPEGT